MEITAANWARLSPLVDIALDLASDERGAWLHESEAVRALTAEQRTLLIRLIEKSEQQHTEKLLATLPQFDRNPNHIDNVDGFDSGDKIGPYTLVEKVGVGGMSEVWRALRSDGAYEREVALKLPFANSTGVSRHHFIRRMERERDMLLRLEHPNIARFYDAGVADTKYGAQPYLALEYVNGVSITEHATTNKLTIEARCRLFLQVLDAVQYAHQRLVVHRDLKPSNILVRENGQVALLDFGIAKMLDQETKTGESTQLTREIGRAVTLAYASPEQVLGEVVTTATDVYSAGVLLYELLCGQRPFVKAETSHALRLLQSQTLPPAKLSDVAAASNAIPIERLNIKRQLMKPRYGDLDYVVRYALRYTSADRYNSALSFAQDLQRYLDKRPVLARKNEFAYRFRKFVERNRKKLILTAAVCVPCVILSIATVKQYNVANQESARNETFNSILNGVLEGVEPESSESKRFSPKEILDRAVARLPSEVLSREFELVGSIAERYRSIGEFKEALRLQNIQLTSARLKKNTDEVVTALLSITETQVYAGDYQSARRALAEIAEHSRDTRQLSPIHQMRYHYHASEAEINTAAFDKALFHLSESETNALKQSGDHQRWLGRIASARGFIEKERENYGAAIKYFSQAVEHHMAEGASGVSFLANARMRLGEIFTHMGDTAHATQVLKQASDYFETRFTYAHPLNMQAQYLRAVSHLSNGETSTARHLLEKILDTNDAPRAFILLSCIQLARIEMVDGAYDRSKFFTDKAETLMNQLAQAEPRLHDQGRILRLAAERALRAKRQAETQELLTAASSFPSRSSLGRAQLHVLKGIYALQHDAQAVASNEFSKASVLLNGRVETDPLLLIVKAYSALLVDASLTQSERVALAEQMKKRFGWQPDVVVLAEMIRTGQKSLPTDSRQFPIVF